MLRQSRRLLDAVKKFCLLQKLSNHEKIVCNRAREFAPLTTVRSGLDVSPKLQDLITAIMMQFV